MRSPYSTGSEPSPRTASTRPLTRRTDQKTVSCSAHSTSESPAEPASSCSATRASISPTSCDPIFSPRMNFQIRDGMSTSKKLEVRAALPISPPRKRKRSRCASVFAKGFGSHFSMPASPPIPPPKRLFGVLMSKGTVIVPSALRFAELWRSVQSDRTEERNQPPASVVSVCRRFAPGPSILTFQSCASLPSRRLPSSWYLFGSLLKSCSKTESPSSSSLLPGIGR